MASITTRESVNFNFSIPKLIGELDLVTHAYNAKEAEAERPGAQGLPGLQREFKISPGQVCGSVNR